jgi:hypothetical protein
VQALTTAPAGAVINQATGGCVFQPDVGGYRNPTTGEPCTSSTDPGGGTKGHEYVVIKDKVPQCITCAPSQFPKNPYPWEDKEVVPGDPGWKPPPTRLPEQRQTKEARENLKACHRLKAILDELEYEQLEKFKGRYNLSRELGLSSPFLAEKIADIRDALAKWSERKCTAATGIKLRPVKTERKPGPDRPHVPSS